MMYIQKDARAAIGECIKRTGTVNAVLIEMCVTVYLSFEANLYSVDKKNSATVCQKSYRLIHS